MCFILGDTMHVADGCTLKRVPWKEVSAEGHVWWNLSSHIHFRNTLYFRNQHFHYIGSSHWEIQRGEKGNTWWPEKNRMVEDNSVTKLLRLEMFHRKTSVWESGVFHTNNGRHSMSLLQFRSHSISQCCLATIRYSSHYWMMGNVLVIQHGLVPFALCNENKTEKLGTEYIEHSVTVTDVSIPSKMHGVYPYNAKRWGIILLYRIKYLL